jgi:hypothetical protein
MSNKDNRTHFVNHLEKHLIGPGANTFGVENSEELFAGYPLNTYYSAILFPERDTQNNSQGTIDTNNALVDTVEDDNIIEAQSDIEANGEDDGTKPKNKNTEDTYKAVNSYFPTNCGLTFCVRKSTESIDAEFFAGQYVQTKSFKDIKVELSKIEYIKLINLPSFPFAENLYVEEKDVENNWMFLSKPIESVNRTTKRTIQAYRDTLNPEGKNLIGFNKLDLLTSGIVFKRKHLYSKLSINLANNEPIQVFKDGKIQAVCYLKIIEKGDKKYVKILLKNASEKHPINKFSYSNELLNEKALFQVKIKVKANILPYKDEFILNKYDDEATVINYQHRYLKSYGIGHGTAVTWDKEQKPKWITTDFLPQVGVRNVSNGFRPDEKHLEQIADIKNLSIWTTWTSDEVCDNLEQFVEAYERWINKQRDIVNKEGDVQDTGNNIIKKQVENYERLRKNIDLLRNNKIAYDTFLLTNTAMYIQLVLSIDERFGKEEKELYEFNGDSYRDVDYQSLSFFKNYKFIVKGNEIPIAYRPFQLAFLLLNLEGIVNENSIERKGLVDLLWFPTGGGKTEAYLAVTAFTILWRRINNPNNFEGVSVIMRYTLRLLTAQQFERASRLITALEFLNRQQDDLYTNAIYEKRKIGIKTKPISIGMWVGGATTPNSLERAIAELNSDTEHTLGAKIQKLNSLKESPLNADSIDNVFQVSACPWCGCKTITKGYDKKFVHSFVAGKQFSIECNNTKCEFRNGLPIDVVDDSLYKNPPTLLFATVDKFAQLSHREEGHRFFNSLDPQKLPPDLIIQDELHLLNGPLGSIVGLFEIMVEELCSKGNRKPKIIASTATTRNTAVQIANLYNGRQVNIFPPLGVTYDDNYFSFTDTESEEKRLHVGFMPTGKTSIDSQVRALLPQLLFARILLYKKLGLNDEKMDNYWTIVSYYNSLKDVGRTYNKVNDEITTELKRLHKQYNVDQYQYGFNHRRLMNKTRELTSRIESTKIKSYLNELFTTLKTTRKDLGYRNLDSDVVSLVLASNMLSVGIDVSRLNIMLMNGQPKNTAEYIQASSRVARKNEGLVINLLDSNRAREKSYFENYVPFHQAYYKHVEPLTVTPFTKITFDKVLNSLLVCYVRHIKGLNKDKDAHQFKAEYASDFFQLMKDKLPKNNHHLIEILEEYIGEMSESWEGKIRTEQLKQEELKYKKGLIANSQEFITSDEELFALMNSMREIDTNSVMEVNIYKSLNQRKSDGTEETKL